jgi:hypothetical protein
MPKTKRKRAYTHWIIPFSETQKPYQQRITDPLNYQANDIILISKDLLARFKAVNSAVSPTFTYAELHTNQQRVAKKFEIKEMGAPFGKGTFSSSAGIAKGDWLVYSGLYGDRNTFAGSTSDECRYAATLDDGVEVDARNIINIARYAQHLPDEDDEKLIKSLDEPVAVENMPLRKSYFSITLSRVKYTVPFNRIVALYDIAPKKKVGYSYGNGYWWGQQIVPSIFDPDGKPIKKRRLTAFYQSETRAIDSISILLNEIDEAQFLRERYFRLNSISLFILPKQVTQLTQGAANGVMLPAVFYIRIEKNNHFNHQLITLTNRVDGEMILLELNNSKYSLVSNENSQHLLNFVKNVQCHAALIQVEDCVMLGVRIIDVAQLDIDVVKNLFARLNTEIEPETHCTLSVLICPSKQNEVFTSSRSKNNFFSKNLPLTTQPANPFQEQKADDAVKLVRG